MVKAIVFDIGGVLIDLDVPRCIRAFQDGMGFARITELLDPCHQKGIYGDLEQGILDADHFRDLILAESRPGCKRSDVDECMGALLAGVNPRTAAVVSGLKGRYRLYLASNNNPISMPRCEACLAQNGLAVPETFQGKFVSSELKILKPSPAFYQAVIDGIGLPAGEILFIDDSAANVAAAREAGMQARLFVPGSDLGILLSDC